MYQPTEVTFTDPRTFDGDPYDVAERAVAQCAGILDLYGRALDVAMLMARNAHMERNLALQRPPAGAGYLDTVEGKLFLRLSKAIDEARKTLSTLEKAVAFNPKHPPRA